MTEIDVNAISTMDFAQCMQLREAIELRVVELQTVKADELRERWRQEALALGMDAEMLLDIRHGKKRGRGRGRRNNHETV